MKTIQNPTKQQIQKAFKDNFSVEVGFIKADGSFRRMKATRDKRYLPKGNGNRVVPARQCVVYDLDKQDIRSFVYDRVQALYL